MSVLSAVLAGQFKEIACGPIWLRVRLLDSPAMLDARLAMQAVGGAVAAADKPDDAAPARLSVKQQKAMADAAMQVVAASVVAIAQDAAGTPGEWEPCTVVLTEADEDPAAGKVAASSLDRIAPGFAAMVTVVAMHQMTVEAGVLRPFSAMSAPSSA